jgi:membrane protease YdiL (CAAX protease family)
MHTLPIPLYAHLLAIYFFMGIPSLGYIRYRRAQRQITGGNDPRAKVQFLRELVIKQAINIFLVCGLWLYGGVAGPSLGLGAPASWWLTGGLAAATAGILVVSAIRLRGKAGRLREKFDQRAGALLPNSMEERRWFAAVCVGGGIFEELAYRGFLFYYLGMVFPHSNIVEKVVVSALLFGIMHIYQGWRGIASTGAAGLLMAGFYVAGGNLLLPVVAHIIANMRVLLIFRPERTRAAIPKSA